ncbi:MAG: hypothetical protein EU547_04920, partial [Promethearchaeota archaeon]
MKFNKTMKIRYGATLLIFALFLGGLISLIPTKDIYTTQTPQTSALTLDPISILVYTEYADTTSPSNQEFANTMSAIDTYYGSNYNYANLRDYTNLGSVISNYDVLLILEQEKAPNTTIMTTIGNAWETYLPAFTKNGGIVITLDCYAPTPSYYGISRVIIDVAELMDF